MRAALLKYQVESHPETICYLKYFVIFLWSEYSITEFFIFEYLKYFFVELKLAEFKFQIPKPHFNNIQVEALNN